MKRPITQNLQRITWMASWLCAVACTPALNWRQVVVDDARIHEALAAWRLASMAPLHASLSNALPEIGQIKGVHAETPPVRTRVVTDQHQVQWVWFVHADKIYQAAVYDKPKDKGLSDAAETYL